MNVFFKRSRGNGVSEIVNPRNSDSDGLELAILRPASGRPLEAASPGRESLLVILGGTCSIAVQGAGEWKDLGGRADVFDGVPTSVYVPAGLPYRISAAAPVEIAALRATAPDGGQAYVIQPRDVVVAVRGDGPNKRTVYTILDESKPAQRLVAGETFNEPGGWSSYPPHRHDRHDPPREAVFQEVYYFRVKPKGGFGFQRLYSPERHVDSTFVVEDGDTVLIPWGYHPVVAAPGYKLYYLWALAGEGRKLMASEDPAHAWVAKNA
ncbi:MAG TPA: 5-deoxy-glucuronate isomerase [bacterium]|nr:5-deoxy-glucuronate isomerase [bacterium]